LKQKFHSFCFLSHTSGQESINCRLCSFVTSKITSEEKGQGIYQIIFTTVQHSKCKAL